MSRFATRRSKLRRLMKQQGLDSLLITNYTNVTYLTGFTGDDSYMLINRNDAVMISDSRYTVQLAEECPDIDVDIRTSAESIVTATAKIAKRIKSKVIGLESDSLTLSLSERLGDAMQDLKFESTSGLVEKLREIKDKHEIQTIRKAVKSAQRGFDAIKATMTGDQTEREIAFNLEHQMRQFGANGTSFDPIVAVGPRAALPHANPTHQQIKDDDFVLIDWGANHDLYMSDITRVLVTGGKVSKRLEKVYNTVLKANTSAIKKIRPGAVMKNIDATARNIIGKAGFGKYFGHSLGHGIGLVIHELPRLASNNDAVLEPGMVVTVEPGIYIPGWGGVRIEDDVLVTKDGFEVLTSVPKKLENCILDL